MPRRKCTTCRRWERFAASVHFEGRAGWFRGGWDRHAGMVTGVGCVGQRAHPSTAPAKVAPPRLRPGSNWKGRSNDELRSVSNVPQLGPGRRRGGTGWSGLSLSPWGEGRRSRRRREGEGELGSALRASLPSPFPRQVPRAPSLSPSGRGSLGHFFRLKSTATTFEPSSIGTAVGPSFSASSWSPSASSAPSCAWKRSSKLTAGSWNAVIAEYGITSFDGTWLKLSPIEKR